jgi:hypothetical protein
MVFDLREHLLNIIQMLTLPTYQNPHVSKFILAIVDNFSGHYCEGKIQGLRNAANESNSFQTV